MRLQRLRLLVVSLCRGRVPMPEEGRGKADVLPVVGLALSDIRNHSTLYVNTLWYREMSGYR